MSEQATKQSMKLDYPIDSAAEIAPDRAHVRVALERGRGAVGLRAKVHDPGLFRDAMLTAIGIRTSDLRFKARDRSQYLAYLMKKGKTATKEIWEAHKAFLEQSYAEDKHRETTLDPVWTVHPDELSLEVFSKDESAYARLSIANELFSEREASHGTTFADLTPALAQGLERLRTYHPLTLEADAKSRAPEGVAARQARDVELSQQWLRGFLQVQSAATLPAAVAEFSAIDLYNLLFLLRTKKAKKPPRALRFELVPGMAPRMVVEPWEVVLESHAGFYQGKTPRVVRTFGRQRLMGLARLLPYVRKARVFLLGAGLPTFWVLECGTVTLTLALTGWVDAGWASAATFDALVPSEDAVDLSRKVLSTLSAKGPLSLEALCAATGATPAQLRSATQWACLHGELLFDIARGVYRPRALFAAPVDDGLVRYGSEREAKAHRILAEKNAVKISKLHEIAGEGVEIHGDVNDKAASRSVSPRFTIDLEGRVVGAWCGCPHYRRAAMREGPCEHMIALRLAYARRRAQEEALRQTPEGRKLIRAETRTLVRRDALGQETVYRVTLDDRVVRIAWGARGGVSEGAGRLQRLWFDTDREAREAYFARLDTLSAEGFIDAADA
jgi:hypothetical protein